MIRIIPIEVTVDGIKKYDREEQLLKACVPMDVRPPILVMDLSLEQ